VYALVVGHLATDRNGGDNLDVVNFDGAKGNLAVVDQQGVAHVDVFGEALQRRGADVLGTGDVFGGDGERVANSQLVRAVDKTAKADLGTLEVSHDGHGLVQLRRSLADMLVGVVVDGVVAVAHVHAGNVNAGFQHCESVVVAGDCRAESCHNFRASHIPTLSSVLLIELKIIPAGAIRPRLPGRWGRPVPEGLCFP